MPVRHATPADVPALAPALARAFQENPATSWAYANPRTRPRWAGNYFAWQLRRLIPQEVTWTTSERDGAAIWALPGRWRESPADLLRLLAVTLPGYITRLPRVARGMSAIDERHPNERHMYLAVLGVDPSHQGQGVGSGLMAPGLELCDREGIPAYLETDTERNVAFYSRHGFRVRTEVVMPRGPRLWLMWREPAR